MDLGFIGLGNMGHPMAANLVAAGHHVTVHDLRRDSAGDLLEAGASWAESPMEVARKSTVILTSLPGPQQVEDATLRADGILAGATPGSAYIDLSTNSPAVIKKIAVLFEGKGVDVLDAPVSGGSPGARAGTLAIMVGGNKEVFDRYSDILKCIASNIFYAGDVGSGNKVKLVNNLMGAVNLFNSIECMVLAKKLGLDVKTVFEVIKAGGGDSFVFHEKLPRSLFVGNFEPGFAVDWAYKDLDLGTQLARDAGVPLTLASTVQQKLVELRGRGWGDKDWTSFAILLEEALGVNVRF